MLVKQHSITYLAAASVFLLRKTAFHKIPRLLRTVESQTKYHPHLWVVLQHRRDWNQFIRVAMLGGGGGMQSDELAASKSFNYLGRGRSDPIHRSSLGLSNGCRRDRRKHHDLRLAHRDCPSALRAAELRSR